MVGTSTLDAANRFLAEYWVPLWNERFAVEPRDARDVHRPLPPGTDLEALFAETETRRVARDFTVRFKNRYWQIPEGETRGVRPGAEVGRRAPPLRSPPLPGSVNATWRSSPWVIPGPRRVGREGWLAAQPPNASAPCCCSPAAHWHRRCWLARNALAAGSGHGSRDYSERHGTAERSKARRASGQRPCEDGSAGQGRADYVPNEFASGSTTHGLSGR